MQENNNNNNGNNNAMDVETTDDTKAQVKAEPKANSMDVDNDATNDTTAADVKPTNDTNNDATVANTDNTNAVNDSSANTNETNVKPKPESMDVEQTDGKTSESKERDEKKNDDDNVVLPVIPFDKCLKGYLFESIAADWMSPATGKKGLVKKSYKLKTFPEYLAVKIARYYIDKHWTPQKYEVEVPVPESIDISFMRGKGLQTNEDELPSDTPKKAKMEAKQEIVDAIVNMGFATKNAAIRAALAVQNANADMAVGWLMEHMTDADINDPIPDDSNDNNNSTGAGYKPDPNVAATLAMTMGFTQKQCEAALISTKGDQNRAVEWLFSHESDLDAQVKAINDEQNALKQERNKKTKDGSGKYNLISIVSHQGGNTGSGHYVAHIKKNNKWYFFNDDRVAISQKTPFKYGYLYIFKRN